MKKLALALSLFAAQSALADSYLQELQKIESQIKISVTVQYQCLGSGVDADRIGFVTFDKTKVFNNSSNLTDRTNWATTGKNDLLTAKLVPAAPINHSYTSLDVKVWEYMPETIKGIRAVGGDNTRDLILTFDEATTSELGSNAQTFANEQVEQIQTVGKLVDVNHTNGKVVTQQCDVIIQKCSGVNCVTRVVLQNYHKPFKMNLIK